MAVLNGLVLISAINKRPADGIDAATSVIDGAMERLRPVPMATVVIGGLITPTVLTLFVLPAITGVVLRRRARATSPKIRQAEPAQSGLTDADAGPSLASANGVCPPGVRHAACGMRRAVECRHTDARLRLLAGQAKCAWAMKDNGFLSPIWPTSTTP